jgi:hypothetical protein
MQLNLKRLWLKQQWFLWCIREARHRKTVMICQTALHFDLQEVAKPAQQTHANEYPSVCSVGRGRFQNELNRDSFPVVKYSAAR